MIKEIALLKLNIKLNDTSFKEIEPGIRRFFSAFGIKPTHRLILKFSDYPDIYSVQFEHRKYTENCDDMESLFRANLYYLMQQNKNLLWKYQMAAEPDQVNAFFYIFFKPLSLLTQRIHVGLDIPRPEVYEIFARFFVMFGTYKHYLHDAETETGLCNKHDWVKWDELTTVISLYLLQEKYSAHAIKEMFTKKVLNKVFPHNPYLLLKQKTQNEVMSAYQNIQTEGRLSTKELLKELQINEYELL